MKIRYAVAMIAALGLTTVAQAQFRNNTTPTLKCNDGNNGGRQERFCEIREQTVPYAGQINVDALDNGGVSIRGWDRSDMLVRMKVEAGASTEAEARGVTSQVRVNLGAGRIAADGPSQVRGQSWSVSYEIFAPHQANVVLKTINGGVHVEDMRGNIEFNAVNGGVHLTRVDGHVHGQTTNGGVHIELAGSRFEGEGMDVTTANGGVHLMIPANYSAKLDASTSNGGLHVDYPVTVTGKIGKQITASLGSGGAPIRVSTTNGGLHVSQM